MGGVGSAIALVPIFDFLGLGFNLSKAIALFVNTSTTVTASFMNFKRGVLDFRFALPLVVSSMLASPFGAYSSRYIDIHYVKTGFLLFLLFSATMMLIPKKSKNTQNKNSSLLLVVIGLIIGYISGLLGVGGGALAMPLMILLGYDAKKMAVVVSFMIPFSTFSAFLSYASFVHLDFYLLFITAFGAVIGGFIGNKIMHNRLSSKQIKFIIALLLYILAFKMGYSLLRS